MDVWIDKYNMDIEVILEACSKSKNISKPSVSYINGIIEKWKDKNVKTLEDIKILDEEHKAKIEKKSTPKNSTDKVPQVKTRYHNINQTFTNYSPDELEKLLQESQKGKFK